MLKKIPLIILLLLGSLKLCFSQCADFEENKVLLIGDSWAFFMGVDGTINNVFDRWGHTNKRFLTTVDIAVNGARTTDFLEQGMQDDIQEIITNNPSIEVIHLSIAGNDVLGQWNVSFTQTELDDLVDEVYTQTLDIISFLKTTKPGIKIVFSGYVYPNFEEVIEDAAPLQTAHPFYGTWQGMGFPSFLEINTILNDFSELIEVYAASDPQVEFFKIPGLMQYTFGQNSALGVAPGGSYPPFTQPMPFGNPSYPSPKNSMRDYFGVTKDCFHLSPKGYRDLISYHTQKFYHKYLMDDQHLFSSINIDAGISSQGQITGLQLGSNQGEEFGMILDFETQNMNWNTVENAEIFIQIKEINGDNPLNAPLEISIQSGNIGASASVEISDWNEVLNESGTPCIFGDKNDVGAWLRIQLPPNFLPYLKDQSNTQIFLKSTNTSDGTIAFTDATNPDFAPVLNLKYDETFTPIKTVAEENLFQVYPNPVNDFMVVESKEQSFDHMKIYDALGRVQLEQAFSSSTVNVSSLNPGFYQVILEKDGTYASKSFIKK